MHEEAPVLCRTLTAFTMHEDTERLVSVVSRASQRLMLALRATQMALLLPGERVSFDITGPASPAKQQAALHA